MKNCRPFFIFMFTFFVIWGSVGGLMGKICDYEPPVHADAIVALGGGSFGEREDMACEVYRAGYVDGPVILTGANREEFVPNRQAYIQGCGVPGQVIMRWPDVTNTFEEMSEVARQIRSGQLHKVIVVSDPPHIPRLRYLRKVLDLKEDVIFIQSRLSASLAPGRLYRLIVFWYREPLAYLYYRMKYL